jgi:hypothetical protein
LKLYRNRRLVRETPFCDDNTTNWRMGEGYVSGMRNIAVDVPRIVAARLVAARVAAMRVMHLLRALAIAAYVRELQTFLSVLRTDPSVAAFADGTNPRLLAYFDHLLDARLGRYAELLAEPVRHELTAD